MNNIWSRILKINLNMKYIIFIILVVPMFPSLCLTQSLDRSVLSAFGQSYAGSSLQTDFTTGEVITFTGQSDDSFLTQGFHQPATIVSICQTPHEETIVASACNTFELNGETYTTAGEYIQTLTADDGCDSIIYLNLQFNELSNLVTSIENTLMANQDDASYAWTLCGDNEILSTSQVFTPAVSGEYQVNITQEDCEAVSECVSFVVSVDEIFHNVELTVFPNPTRENLQLEVKGSNELFGLTIYDAMGNMVMTEAMNSSKTKLSVGHFANGTYVIVLRSNFSVFTKTFVKGQ